MNSQKRKEFAARLELAIKATGMKKAQFARAIPIGDTTLTNYLAGQTAPGFDELEKICEITGASIQWLMFGAGPQYAVDIPTAAGRIDVQRFFTVVQTVSDQASILSVQLEPLELAQIVIEMYERFEDPRSVDVEQIARRIEVEIASRPGASFSS